MREARSYDQEFKVQAVKMAKKESSGRTGNTMQHTKRMGT